MKWSDLYLVRRCSIIKIRQFIFAQRWMNKMVLKESKAVFRIIFTAWLVSSSYGASMERPSASRVSCARCSGMLGHTLESRYPIPTQDEIDACEAATAAELNEKLLATAQHGHGSLVQVLLNKGAQVNFCNGCTALHNAVHMGHEDVVRILLAVDGVNVNARDNEGRTPLHCAVSNCITGQFVVGVLLRARGIDVNARDLRGRTPLHDAAASGCGVMVQKLIKAAQC